ncbi:ribonuclease H-like domain-containing protein [Tanacetum coccineum]
MSIIPSQLVIIITSLFISSITCSGNSDDHFKGAVFNVNYKFYGRKKVLDDFKAFDVLLYYAKIGIGTPPKDYYVQVDTGSDIMWINCVHCQTCLEKVIQRIYSMAGSDDENPPPPPPSTPTQQVTHTVSTIKLPILKKAIKSRFGGNDESKKMQKYILKQQFEGFSVSNSKGLHKGYDRFQSLLSQLEIHGALKMQIRSSLGHYLFLGLNTNDVSTSSGHNSQRECSSSYIDELMYSFFANQSSGPQSDHEDLEQLDEFDLEEIDLKWQEPVRFDKTKVECFNCHKTWHFAKECKSKGNQDFRRRDAGNNGYKAKDNGRRPGKQEEPKALVTLDGDGVDWTSHSEDEQENFSLMAYSNLGSDTKVTSCSKECKESYAKLKKLYDEKREQLGDASIEIQAYDQALKKVEPQLVAHQKNQLWYEEKIRFMKIDLDDKTDVLTYHKKLLAEAVKEKEELKTKLEGFQNYSKGLKILLNSQMSVKDKVGLGYGNQMHEGVLSYENEVFQSVFDSRSSDIEDSLVNDRYAEGMHAVPPPMTGIYISFGPDFEIDESQYTYGQKQSKTSESDARTSDYASCESNSNVETLESVPKPVANEPKVVNEPKVWSDAPIIEEYESDSDDEHVIIPSKEQEKPSFAFVNTIKHVKTPKQTVKDQDTYSQSPKPNKRDWNGLMSKKLGLRYRFTRKACFVCGSFSHLIRDCDFHEKRMAKQVELNKQKGKLLLRPQQVVIGDPKDITGTMSPNTIVDQTLDDPQKALKNKGIVDSGCSRHMTGNKAYLVEYQDYNGGLVAFGGSKGHITGKGKIRTGKLDFEDMCFVKELQHFNLFSVSQMCDKKNKYYAQVEKILHLKSRIKKLEKKCKPSISHHRAWLKSVKRLSLKKWFGKKESVSKQGRKTAKPGPTLDDSTFDDLDTDGMDYMETEDVVNEGRLSKETKELNVTHDTEVLEKGGSNEEPVSVAEVSTATPMTPPTTTTSIFDDEDITMAQTLIKIKEEKVKEKGVSIKEVEDSDRPVRSILTLKPLPTIDPKDKGKGVLKESPVKKVKRSDMDAALIAKDVKVSRLVYEEELAELERERRKDRDKKKHLRLL